MSLKTIIFSIVFSSDLIINAHAATMIYGIELPNRMSKNNGLQYDLFLDELSDLGLEFDIKVVPHARRLRLFKTNTRACVFPSGLQALQRNELFIGSKLITGDIVDYAGLVAITKNNSLNIKKLADLSGKSIAKYAGINFSHLLKNVKYRSLGFAESDSDLIKMLYRDRVDVILAFMPDILLETAHQNLPMPHVTDLWLVKKQGMSFICHDTLENREFLEEFNKKLKEVKASGKLREIMGPYINLTNGPDEFF